MPKVARLCIGWPWEPPTVYSKVMDNYLSLQRPESSFWVRGLGQYPARRHIDICEKALVGKASHILIIGADQIHPTDMVPRLISRMEQDGCDVISALVPTNGKTGKVKYFQKCAWVQGKLNELGNWDLINPTEDLMRITGIGSGVLMFPVSALHQLERPWFIEHFNTKTYERIHCMDTEFVHRLELEAGLKLWVDTTIMVKHYVPLQVDETFMDRFDDWNDTGN